jgi:hypothetical protein
VRLVKAHAGPQLAAISADPAFDNKTKAAAGALW